MGPDESGVVALDVLRAELLKYLMSGCAALQQTGALLIGFLLWGQRQRPAGHVTVMSVSLGLQMLTAGRDVHRAAHRGDFREGGVFGSQDVFFDPLTVKPYSRKVVH